MKFNLESKDVSLRYLTEKDAYNSVVWRNNPEVWELTVNRPDREITIEDELQWIRKVIPETNSYRFAILYQDTYVGNIQLTNVEDYESYFGVFIGDLSVWGKGVAKMATKLILTFAFNHLNLKAVKLRVKVDHTKAFGLYNKIGFKEINRDEELIYMRIEKQ